MARVVLAMSGGVDSSVAAHLLKCAGHDCVGVFMRHGGEREETCEVKTNASSSAAESLLPVLSQRPGHKQGCCSASDAEDGRRVADRLEIPFYALDLQEDFDRIIDYFVDEYTHGRTPNPCVMCNNWLKFGRLFDYADSIGADFVATGHYARLTPALRKHGGGAEPALRRGLDGKKDQSYVLFGIERRFLSRMLLPIGDFSKPRIRELAAEIGLRVADKKDSQEICFVASGHHDEFVRRRRGAEHDTAGEVVTGDGRVVARHAGVEGFTIGQRKGLGVAMGEPYFVVRIEAEERRVVIGPQSELARSSLTASNVNWLCDPPAERFSCLAQIRYNSAASPAEAQLLPGDRLQLDFESPRAGVAPGQAVVCYDGDRVLGGGWID